MIPTIAVLHIHSPNWRSPHLWLPLFLLWIPMLVLAPLILAVLLVACLALRIRFVRAVGTFWAILCALPGTDVRVSTHDTNVFVQIL